MNSGLKRLVALILALCMALSLLSAGAWAEEVEDNSNSSSSVVGIDTDMPAESEDNEEDMPAESEDNEEDMPAEAEDSDGISDDSSQDDELDTKKVDEKSKKSSEDETKSPETLSTMATSSGECGEKTRWTFDDTTGTLTISGEGSIEGCSEWYDLGLKEKVQELIIEQGVTCIDYSAFPGFYHVRSVTIPDGVTKIRDFAFDGCRNLTSIIIPSSVYYISEDAFLDVSSDLVISGYKGTAAEKAAQNQMFQFLDLDSSGVITDYRVHSGTCGENLSWVEKDGILTLSGKGGFDGTTKNSAIPWYSVRHSIKEVVIQPGVTKVGTCSFSDFRFLKKVSIPNTVTYIGSYAFEMCSSLTDITIPGSVKGIGTNAFGDCEKLSSVKILKGVERIGAGSFVACPSLTSIDIPDGVSYIGSYAFEGCKNLVKVTIPKSASSIEGDAFAKCNKDLTIYGYTGSAAEKYAKNNGVKFESLGKATATATLAKTTLSSVKAVKGQKMTVTWKKNSKGTGYEIQFSTDKNFKKGNKSVKISSNTTTSKTITKLTASKTYYVRIRTVKGKKTSAWSATKSVKTHKR